MEKLIPFDLEKAKAGAPVQTTGGYKVELAYFDMGGKYPLGGRVFLPDMEGFNARWALNKWTDNGKCFSGRDASDFDLCMVPQVKTLYRRLARSTSNTYFDVINECSDNDVFHDKRPYGNSYYEWIGEVEAFEVPV